MPLGKSLDNILTDYFGQTEVSLDVQTKAVGDYSNNIQEIFIGQIELSPYQTRSRFEKEKIESLAQNIKENGLFSPIVVLRKKVTDTTTPEYVLLAGERRLRAAKTLGWTRILAVVKTEDELSEKQQAMISAMENLQREDLSPIELAQTFKMLMLTQNMNEEDLAKLLGNSVQYVKNYLRLISLGQKAKDALLKRQIGEGQARHLVGLEPTEQEEILEIIIQRDLTVKEILNLIQERKKQKSVPPKTKNLSHNLPPEIWEKADKLDSGIPNSKLQCLGDLHQGKIVISWKSTE